MKPTGPLHGWLMEIPEYAEIFNRNAASQSGMRSIILPNGHGAVNFYEKTVMLVVDSKPVFILTSPDEHTASSVFNFVEATLIASNQPKA